MKYKPNEIWNFFFSGNDLADNSPLVTAPPLGPYYLYSQQKPPQLTDILFGFPKPPSLLHREISERYAKQQATFQNIPQQVLPYLYSDEQHPALEVVLEETLRCFDLIRRLVKPHQSLLRVVYLPARWEVDRMAWQEFQETARRHGVKAQLSPDKGERRMATLLQGLGVSFVSLRPLLLGRGAAQMYSDHLSPLGHREVALFLAAMIIKEAKAVAPRSDEYASDAASR